MIVNLVVSTPTLIHVHPPSATSVPSMQHAPHPLTQVQPRGSATSPVSAASSLPAGLDFGTTTANSSNLTWNPKFWQYPEGKESSRTRPIGFHIEICQNELSSRMKCKFSNDLFWEDVYNSREKSEETCSTNLRLSDTWCWSISLNSGTLSEVRLLWCFTLFHHVRHSRRTSCWNFGVMSGSILKIDPTHIILRGSGPRFFQ